MATDNLISGIFNYCDRWCERCRFIDRCAVGVEEQMFWEKEKTVKNEEEWKKLVTDTLSENFAQTTEMVQRWFEERGIDLEAILEQEHDAYERSRQELAQFAENDETIKLAKKYTHKVMRWKGRRNEKWINPEKYIQQFDLGIRSEVEIREEFAQIDNYLSIINFYCTLIGTKVHRAVTGYFQDKDDQDWPELKRDYLGTAKLCGILITRSINAWISLSQLVPEIEEDAITFLALLQKLQRTMKEKFPNAEKFIRPGFDTIAE